MKIEHILTAVAVVIGGLLVWELFLHDLILGADGKSGLIGGMFKK